jgi:hypothetical protein
VLQAIAGAIRIFALAGWEALTSLHTIAFLVLLVFVGVVAAGYLVFRGSRRR